MRLRTLASAGALLALACAPLAAQAKPTARDCFLPGQWSGWSTPSPDVLYMRVNVRDIYRVDLAAKNHALKSAGNYLISQVRGGGAVCSALDLDLAVSEGHGFRTALFPKTLTKLTPEEIAAIPRKDLP